MTSKRSEDRHQRDLETLLVTRGLECVRSAQDSEEEELEYETDELVQIEEEDESIHEEAHAADELLSELVEEEHLAHVFPTLSLRKMMPERLRKIQEENQIHVLPRELKKVIDPASIPKINQTAPQKYIDILADLVGCERYTSSLAEFWFLDTMANLLRRAQDDGLDRSTQAVLMLWFCEWMKEMQHFDAADRQRMMKRFKDTMLSAASFIALEDKLPTPAEAGVYYTSQDELNPVASKKSLKTAQVTVTQTPTHLLPGPGQAVRTPTPPGQINSPSVQVTFETKAYDCCLKDLVKIIHYIFDLFSSDYQYNLVRSVFTFTPDYTILDAPYQMQNPKRVYAPLKTKPKKEKSPKKEKAAKGKKIIEDTKEFLALMELKAREEKEIDEREDREREDWNRRSHILPLNLAVDDTFLDKYWPPPPEPEPEPVQEVKTEKEKKNKKK